MLIRLHRGWVDSGTLRYEVDGNQGRLTEREGQLLDHLARAPGEPCSREDLLEQVFGYNRRVRTRALDLAVLRLRKKIEVDPSNPAHLLTVPQVGYKLVSEEAPVSSSVLDLQRMMEEALSLDRSWAALDPGAQRTLAVVSLFSEPVRHATLERAFGATILGQVELLTRDGLLRRVGDGVVVARTVRELARGAVTEDDRARYLAWATALAEQALVAERTAPQDELLAHARELLALAALQPEDTSALLETAVICHLPQVTLPQLESLDVRTRDRGATQRARTLRSLIGHPITGAPHLRSWARELEVLHPHLPAVERSLALLQLSRLYRHLDANDAAFRAASEARALLEREDAPALASWAWLQLGSLEEGARRQHAFEQAALHARRAGSTMLAALALGGLATSAPSPSAETLRLVRMAVDLIPSGADGRTHSRVLTNLAGVALLCDPDEAAPICQEAVEVARQRARPVMLGSALVVRADLEHSRGQLEQALATLEQARTLTSALDVELRTIAILAGLFRMQEAQRRLARVPDERSPTHELLHRAARACIALASDGEAPARAIACTLDELAPTVQEQTDLAPLLHRGLWSPRR